MKTTAALANQTCVTQAWGCTHKGRGVLLPSQVAEPDPLTDLGAPLGASQEITAMWTEFV